MDEFEKAFNYTLRFLSYRSRSEKEIIEYFTRKKIPALIQQRILTKLKELDFVNDEKFALWWITQRKTYKPISSVFIKFELKKKGIHEETIEKAFKKLETEIGSESDSIKQLLQKVNKKYEKLPPLEKKNKIIQFFMRRGFSYDTIKNALPSGGVD